VDPQEVERVTQALLAALEEDARRRLFTLTAECLGSVNVTILSALGVDVKAKLLHIFVEELNQHLKPKETDNAE
jgi:hypothetical protein